jgi:hypothetical protein
MLNPIFSGFQTLTLDLVIHVVNIAKEYWNGMPKNLKTKKVADLILRDPLSFVAAKVPNYIIPRSHIQFVCLSVVINIFKLYFCL